MEATLFRAHSGAYIFGHGKSVISWPVSFRVLCQPACVQFYADDFRDRRPVPPEGCPGKMGTPCPCTLHRKDFYWRYRHANSMEKDVLVECLRCPLSSRCFSIIPEGMMPYRSLPSSEAGTYANHQSGLLPREQTPVAQKTHNNAANGSSFGRLLAFMLSSLPTSWASMSIAHPLKFGAPYASAMVAVRMPLRSFRAEGALSHLANPSILSLIANLVMTNFKTKVVTATAIYLTLAGFFLHGPTRSCQCPLRI